jgi:hypothetical protein
MPDKGCSSPECPDKSLTIIPLVPPNESPQLKRRALRILSIHDPITPEEADTYSQCTKISLEVAPLKQDSNNRLTIESPY